MKIDSAVFLNSSRFDILAKYIYAKLFLQKRETNYGKEIYYNHLKVWNDCQHGDGKNGFNEYLKSFNDLLSSIKKEGFDPEKSKVNTTSDFRLLNGGHRVAACLFLDKDIHYEEGGVGQTDVDYNYFLNKRDFVKNGLHQKYCDSIALEYCKIKPNTFIATIFPSADGNLLRAEQIMTKQADVFYKKTLRLSGNGPLNLMRQMYDGETWGGNHANNYVGLREKASLCFQRDEDVHVYVITVKESQDTTNIKKQIRELFNIGNHSIHINNTWEETLKLSKCFFNSNSISYINKAKLANYPVLEQCCNYFGECIKKHFLDGDNYCITGSSVLSVLGLREGKDLDYLHRGPRIDGHPDIDSHNEYSKGRYTKTVDDIIYNPENHFYFNGLKYASLGVVKALKEKRNEEKDQKDIKLIDQLINSI